MLIRQVALVSESNSVQYPELLTVAAALQKQVTRDFSPIWEINATVDAFASVEDIPIGYWTIKIVDTIDENAAGYHTDDHGQPFALVLYESDWSVTASHECLEMLGDPFGNRLIAGQSPKPDQGRVSFLVEVCDPSESFTYSVNGVLVSDFYTPNYFDPEYATSVRYSYLSAVTKPRQVLKGGYLSWNDPLTGEWWQLDYYSSSKPKFITNGKLSSKNGIIREQIDRLTSSKVRKSKYMNMSKKITMVKATQKKYREATVASAMNLNRSILNLTKKGQLEMANGIPLDTNVFEDLYSDQINDGKLKITIAEGFKDTTETKVNGSDAKTGDRQIPMKVGSTKVSITPGPCRFNGPVLVTFTFSGLDARSNLKKIERKITINNTIDANFTIH